MATANDVRIIELGWNQGDLSIIDELVHPDYVRHTATGEVRGRDGFKQLIRAGRAALPDLHVEVDEVVADDTRRCARFTVTGTAGESPTRFVGMVMTHWLDGLLVDEWEAIDLR